MKTGKLRAMTVEDLEMVLKWRNHHDVRRYMYTTHEIGWDEHLRWFSRARENPSVNLLIFEYHGDPCGFVNISRGRCSEVAEWGFYLSASAPKGISQSLGQHALAFGFEELGLHKICGQALGFNERSIAFHESIGFTMEGRLREQHFDGAAYHEVVCFGLLGREWRLKNLEQNCE